jgi:hypothetical protein
MDSMLAIEFGACRQDAFLVDSMNYELHRKPPAGDMANLFDHLVGASEYNRRDDKAKCLRRFEVDHELESGR